MAAEASSCGKRIMTATSATANKANEAVTPTHTTTSATDFLREYFRGTKGQTFLGAVRNAGSELSHGHIGYLATRKPDEVAKFAATYDKPEHECAIYYCTATLRDGATRRPAAADCLQFPSLFADIDDANHELDRAAVIE